MTLEDSGAGYDQCVESVDVFTGCGQWVVDILDYLITKYPTPFVTLHVGSYIPTFCEMFVNCLCNFVA